MTDSSTSPIPPKEIEGLEALIDNAGWLLREPLDFASKEDQENIREARTSISQAKLLLRRIAASTEEASQ